MPPEQLTPLFHSGASYVDFRMREWFSGTEPQTLLTSVRRVLSELVPEALLSLKDKRFEVAVTPEPGFSVWAYFPVHRNRTIFREMSPRPETRVLLVFSTAGFAKEKPAQFEIYLRDHLGHVLLYLRNPRAKNECSNASKEWRQSISLETRRRAHRGNK